MARLVNTRPFKKPPPPPPLIIFIRKKILPGCLKRVYMYVLIEVKHVLHVFRDSNQSRGAFMGASHATLAVGNTSMVMRAI